MVKLIVLVALCFTQVPKRDIDFYFIFLKGQGGISCGQHICVSGHFCLGNPCEQCGTDRLTSHKTTVTNTLLHPDGK